MGRYGADLTSFLVRGAPGGVYPIKREAGNNLVGNCSRGRFRCRRLWDSGRVAGVDRVRLIPRGIVTGCSNCEG